MALTVPVAEIVASSKNPLLGKHESWGRVRLGEIAAIQNGFAFRSSHFSRDEGTPLIRIRNVGAKNTDTRYVGEYDPQYIVEPGDLLIGMDGDFNCARWRGPRGLLNQRVCRVTLTSDLYHPKLLDYALPGYLKAINDMTSSVTVKHLSSRSIAEIPLPLPPMDQQRRIVAEIEKQFSRLDEAVANLKRVKANLKRYKAAVLKAAVEGRLVETEADLAHREGRRYETGAQLLERILKTRRSQWSGKGKYKEPAAPDTTDLLELPEGWALASLEQLTAAERVICYGILMPKEHVPDGVLYVKVKDLKGDKVNLASLKRTSPRIATKYARASLKAGDLLLAIRGTYGRVAEVPPELDGGNITQDTVRLAVTPLAVTAFVASFLRSQDAQNYFKRVARGVAVKGVNVSDVRMCAVPVPPVPEQHRIVAEVDRRLSLVLEVEGEVDADLTRADRLRQSILKQAFSGRLASEAHNERRGGANRSPSVTLSG
jgi:type I restriction enzyme S subunit